MDQINGKRKYLSSSDEDEPYYKTTESLTKRSKITSDFISISSGSEDEDENEKGLVCNGINHKRFEEDFLPELQSKRMKMKEIFPLAEDFEIDEALRCTASLQGAIAMCSMWQEFNKESQSSQNSNNADSSYHDSPYIVKPRTKGKMVLESDDSFQSSQNAKSSISSDVPVFKRERRKLLNFSSSDSSDTDNENSKLSLKNKYPRANCGVTSKFNRLDKNNGSTQNGKSKYFSSAQQNGHSRKKSGHMHVQSEEYNTATDENFSMEDVRRHNLTDDDDDSSSDDDNIEKISTKRKNEILEFFQTATLEELTTVKGCSKKTSQRVIEVRPFDSWSDMVLKFQESMFFGRQSFDNIIWNVDDLLCERSVLHELMNKCLKLTAELNKEVSIMQMTHTTCQSKLVAEQPKSIPKPLKLKEYQMVGLNWLSLLHRQNLNGVLADEMGLGKTVQAISLIVHLHETSIQEHPHLIIMPSSTLDNWKREFATWAPDINVMLYYGSQNERRSIRSDYFKGRIKTDVFLTTYNSAISQPDDRTFFCRKMDVGYAIFDEGHMLKNMTSQRYTYLMRIRAKRRLLLTGTPLQNNLLELMSLLRFVMPHMFEQTTSTLTRLFTSGNSEVKSSYAQKCISQAKTIMEPFILRRLKADVLRDLPDKIHEVVHVEMTDEQQKLYHKTCEKYRNKNIVQLAKSDMKNVFMELRKMSNHPLLCRHRYKDSDLRKIAKKLKTDSRYHDSNEHYIFEDMQVMTDFELHRLCETHSCVKSYALDNDAILDSGKFQYLDEVLMKYKESGQRVLLFSQFTMMMDIFEAYLKIRGHKFRRLDGQTAVSTRLELIDDFNDDESIFIFILSTKAGGLGINLTSANVVLLHDIDFNPYNDKQAEDRCHRLGQTKSVEIIRMISRDSIEEGMLKCAEYKLQLEQDITSADDAVPVAAILKEALSL